MTPRSRRPVRQASKMERYSLHNSILVSTLLCAGTQLLLASAQPCPQPCKCAEGNVDGYGVMYKVHCTHNNLQEIPDLSVLTTLSLPIELKLENNKIQSAAASDFPIGLNLVKLDISRNVEIVIEKDAFRNLEATLKSLELDATNLNFDSPLDAVSRLGKLTELSVSHNNRVGYITGAVDHARKTLFHGPVVTSLKILRMSFCGLRKIDRKVLDNLMSLEELDLSNNGFTEVPEAIKDMRNLHKLLLSRCKINSVDDDAFRGAIGLEAIELSDNPITKLSSHALRGLEASLKKLVLERCQLKDIPSQQLRHLKKLEYLDLTMNRFEKTTADSFRGEYCLKTLLISANDLHFHPETFSGQADCVRELTIKHMNMVNIPRAALVKLKTIERLNLEKLHLKRLEKDALSGIKAQRISLSENSLTSIEPGAFLGLPANLEINLRKTEISDIDFLLGYEDDAIATVNLDHTKLYCNCSMLASINVTLTIAIYGSCIKREQTIPLSSSRLRAVLQEACEEERAMNSAGDLHSTVITPGHCVLLWYLFCIGQMVFPSLWSRGSA